MRYFILIMQEFPKIDRREIDKGVLKRETVTLINCVRSSLFTSHGLRRDANVILCPLEPRGRLVRIDGDKLRYMGPDERSISILLSMSARKLVSEKVADEETSSPGITIERKDLMAFVESEENFLVLYQSLEGSDLRRIKFNGETAYFCALDGDRLLGETKSLLGKRHHTLIAIKGANQIENTILLVNTEIDRQLRNDPTSS